MRETQARMAPLFLALRDASSTEPEAHQVWHGSASAGSATCASSFVNCATPAGCALAFGRRSGRCGVCDKQSELYVLLTVDRGWSPRRYERWLADARCRLLLD